MSDGVPQFEVDLACRPVNVGLTPNRTVEACRNDENRAKTELSGKWAQYPAPRRAECEQMVRMGGPPSYVELVTCLDLAQQSKDASKVNGAAVKP
ncbi:MAG: hypothetical protein ACR2K5_04870 [Pseudolabrys sp.]